MPIMRPLWLADSKLNVGRFMNRGSVGHTPRRRRGCRTTLRHRDQTRYRAEVARSNSREVKIVALSALPGLPA